MTPAPGPPVVIEEIDWLRLWAVGRYTLGLTDDDLEGLTFVEFAALAEQHRQATTAADQRAALVAWSVARANGADVELEAFMPKTEQEREMERYHAMMAQLAWFEARAAAQAAAE